MDYGILKAILLTFYLVGLIVSDNRHLTLIVYYITLIEVSWVGEADTAEWLKGRIDSCFRKLVGLGQFTAADQAGRTHLVARLNPCQHLITTNLSLGKLQRSSERK